MLHQNRILLLLILLKKKYKKIIETEKQRLSTKNLEDNQINDKIKKTYKNRYYNNIKN